MALLEKLAEGEGEKIYMKKRNGFTFPELLVVVGITLVLWSIATVSLIRTQTTNSMDVAAELLVADIKSQQTKAFAGDGGSPLGIYFEANKYTLFTGSVYNAADLSNFSVDIDSPVTISTTNIDSSSLIFAPGSGEVVSFISGAQVSLTDSVSGESVTLDLNKFGGIAKN